MGNDVDLAMAGWQQLAQNPDKMGELMKAFKDPDVWAKAQEMIKDPDYMRAAKKKLEQMQSKAKEAGLLDKDGNPVPGAATHAGKQMPAAAQMMAQMLAAQGNQLGA